MGYTKKDRENFLKVLVQKNLNISKACKGCNIDRSTFYEWLKEKDGVFKNQYDAMKEAEIDDSEETMRMLRRGVPKKDNQGKVTGFLIRPDTTANIFFLKTQGKERGWVERTELTGKDGDDLGVWEIVIKDGKGRSK